MENPRPEKENIIKDTRNLFRLKKEQNDTAIKDIRNLFRLTKKVKGMKDIVLKNIENLFEYEKQKENYKPVTLNNFWSNNYIEYKSNGNKNKILSVEEYLNKIRPCLKGFIINLKKSGTWKIQLTTTINLFSFEDDNDEERVMHSEVVNIEIKISDEADKVIKKFFDSLKNRYQNNLESMRGSEFVFDYVHLVY